MTCVLCLLLFTSIMMQKTDAIVTGIVTNDCLLRPERKNREAVYGNRYYIEYKVKDKIYKKKTGCEDKYYSKDKTILIYYYKLDPNKTFSNSAFIGYLILGIILSAFLLYSSHHENS